VPKERSARPAMEAGQMEEGTLVEAAAARHDPPGRGDYCNPAEGNCRLSQSSTEEEREAGERGSVRDQRATVSTTS